MHRFRPVVNVFALLALFVLVPALPAQEGLSRAFLRLRASGQFVTSVFGSSLAAADFNHDHHADAAVLVRENCAFHIELYFVSHQIREITFTAPVSAMTISALDVNRDGYADLVIREVFTHRALFVWVNDGHGSFRRTNVDAILGSSRGNEPRLGSPIRTHQCLPFPVSVKARSRQICAEHHGRNARTPVPFNYSATCFPHATDRCIARPFRGPPPLLTLRMGMVGEGTSAIPPFIANLTALLIGL